MCIKLDFDQQMIDDKDREIEMLFEERKKLRQQVENNEKIGRDDKQEKNERDVRSKREL